MPFRPIRKYFKFHLSLVNQDGSAKHHVQKTAGDIHPSDCVRRAFAAAAQLIQREHTEMTIDVRDKKTGELAYSSGKIPLGRKK